MARSFHPPKWRWRARYFTGAAILFSIHFAPVRKIIQEEKQKSF
jgi:hypothetical protein